MRRAEVEAGRVFRHAATPGGYQVVRSFGGCQSWDECVEVDCTMAQVAARLSGPQNIAGWFAGFGFSRIDDPSGTEVRVGRFRLRISEEWTGHGVRFHAVDADGSTLDGFLTVRAVLLSTGANRVSHQGVEVWVHAEAPAESRAGALMRATRLLTRERLRQMAADLAR
jgi:hypothetical protein